MQADGGSVQIRVEVQEPAEAIGVSASTDPALAQQALSSLAEGKVAWILLEHDTQAGLLFVREGQHETILNTEVAANDKPPSFNSYVGWMNVNFGRRVCRVWMFVLDKTCHVVRWSGPGLARATRSKLIQQAKDITKICIAPFQDFAVQEHSCQSYDTLSRLYYTLTRTEPPPVEEKVEEPEPVETKVEVVEVRPEETPKRAGFSKSLFANLAGKESEEDACSYFKIKPDFACALNRDFKANSQYFVMAWQAGGGSALRVVHLNSELGRCPDQPRCARGLKQQTNAFDLSQLNPRLLAVGAEGVVGIYSLPDISDTRLDILPTSTLPVAGKVTVCMFSPHVDDLLCVASFHPDSGPCLQFWDTSSSECVCSINDLHGKKAIDDAAFSPRSSLLATSGKDRFCTILNPLSADPIVSVFEPKENTALLATTAVKPTKPAVSNPALASPTSPTKVPNATKPTPTNPSSPVKSIAAAAKPQLAVSAPTSGKPALGSGVYTRQPLGIQLKKKAVETPEAKKFFLWLVSCIRACCATVL